MWPSVTWRSMPEGEGLGFDEQVKQMDEEFSAVSHEYQSGSMHVFGAWRLRNQHVTSHTTRFGCV